MSSFVKAEVVRRVSMQLDAANLRVLELEAEVDSLRSENERLKGARDTAPSLSEHLEGFTKAELAEYALDEHGLELNPNSLSKDEMIAALVAAEDE